MSINKGDVVELTAEYRKDGHYFYVTEVYDVFAACFSYSTKSFHYLYLGAEHLQHPEQVFVVTNVFDNILSATGVFDNEAEALVCAKEQSIDQKSIYMTHRFENGENKGVVRIYHRGLLFVPGCEHDWITTGEFEQHIHTGEIGAWHKDQVCSKCRCQRRIGVPGYEGEYYVHEFGDKWFGEIPNTHSLTHSYQRRDGSYEYTTLSEASYSQQPAADAGHEISS